MLMYRPITPKLGGRSAWYCLLLSALAGTAAGAPPGTLRLRTGDVALDRTPSLLAARGAALHTGRRYVLALDAPLSPERREALGAAGAVVEDYLPVNAVLVRASGATPASLAGLGFVTWAGAYSAAWKIDPELTRAGRDFVGSDRRAFETRGRRVVAVHLFDNEPISAGLDAIKSVPQSEVLDLDRLGAAPVIVAAVPAGALGSLSEFASVRFVEELPEFVGRNSTVRWVVQSNVPDSTPLYARGLTGLGQIAGIIDTFVAAGHCSFSDPLHPIGPEHRKILAYNSALGNAVHGTHVAGTVCGDAGAFDDRRGVAYGARLVYNTFPQATESSVFGRFYLHYTQGAVVHNNSWGTEATTAYNGTCVGIDRFCWENDDNLVLFAVSDGSVIKNPENAKNCLAVAATNDAPNQQNFCFGGSGPTSDGRRKPEIMGPGCNITSSYVDVGAGDFCDTTQQSGTSMACPAVAGAGILIRQYFTDGYYPEGVPVYSHGLVPTGALLKAALVNSAVDVTNITGFPGPREGWGRVLADNVLYFPGDVSRLNVRDVHNNTPDALVGGQSREYPVTVNGGSVPLKVTLAYHDAPAAINAAFAPVNDLDLVVTSPQGTVYLGNVFASGVSVPGGTPDAINNLEQVHVPSPQSGVWLVKVAARAVNVGRQGYATVATGELSGPCRADFNGDGVVDGADFDLFVQAFEAGDLSADFNGDRFVDGIDYDWIALGVEEGC